MTERARDDAGAATRGWLLLVVPTCCLVLLYSLLWLVVILLTGTFVLRLEPVVLTSGSMEPGAARGDVVLLEPHDGGVLDAGTVVTFDDPAKPGHLVTHRIDLVLPDGSYRTKGDANRAPDSTPVPPDRIVGTGRLLVPLVALPVTWAQDGQLHLLALLAAVVGVACVGARVPEAPRDGVASAPARTRRRTVEAPREPAAAAVPAASVAPEPFPPLWSGGSFTSRTPPPWAAAVSPPAPVPDGAPGTPEAGDAPEAGRAPEAGGAPEAGRAPEGGGAPAARPRPDPVFDLNGGVWHARRTPPPFRARIAGATRALGNVAAVVAMVVSLSLAPGQRAWAALAGAGSTAGSWTAATIAAPTGLAGTETCLLDASVDLTWSASTSTGVDGYEVWRSTTSGGPYAVIGTTGPLVTSYTDATAEAGGSYHYVVTATDGPWRSASSNEIAILDLCA